MEISMQLAHTWKGIRKDVHNHCKTCPECQLSKKAGKRKYGKLPEKKATVMRWNRVNIDLWGPATVRNKDGSDYQVHAATMIDPSTGWFEVAPLKDGPTAAEVQ